MGRVPTAYPSTPTIYILINRRTNQVLSVREQRKVPPGMAATPVTVVN
jgi:hypothetical protein